MFHYKKIVSDLTFDGVSFPANNNDIDIFEENNKSISINVYEIDDNEQIVISRKLKNKDASCHLDLLRVDEEDCSHYVYIKSLSRLINNQKSNHNGKSYFVNIVIMDLEMKNYYINIMIVDVWKLKDNK